MLDKYTICKEVTVKEAIEKMEKNLIKALLVLNDDGTVAGIFTNGDMRNFFLKGGSLNENICIAMNKKPKLFHSQFEIDDERKEKVRVIYPIVDAKGKLVSVIDYDNQNTRESIVSDALKEIPLVIMAGGQGTRLYPYTKILPKPLIPIGDVTITERIIDSFCKYGCRQVYMILNYKANMIRAYMGDLDKNYSIEFEEEEKFLGTGGGLSLLKDKINNTFFVSNCDTLIDVDFDCVYKTHKKNKNKVTIICSMKDIVIPYGVVESDKNGFIKKIQEKPENSYLINTGVYLIEPDVLNEISDGEFIHLPDLIQRYLDKGENIGVFPISERAWMDMGQFDEMENMKKNLGI